MTRYFFALCFLLSSGFLFSQSFTGGFSGGLVGSQVSGDNLAGYNKPGIYVSAFARRALKNSFFFQAELAYVMKGSKKRVNAEKNDFRYYRMRLNYVEMPLLVNYLYKKKLMIYAGPSVGFLASFSEEDEYGPVSEPRSFSRTETSFNLGFSYPIINNLSIDFRTNNSILPIRPHLSGGTFLFNRGQYNSTINFTLVYHVE